MYRSLWDGEKPYFKKNALTGEVTVARLWTVKEIVTDDWDEGINFSLARSRNVWWRIRENMIRPASVGGTGICTSLEKVGQTAFLGKRVQGMKIEEYLPRQALHFGDHELAIDPVRMCLTAHGGADSTQSLTNHPPSAGGKTEDSKNSANSPKKEIYSAIENEEKNVRLPLTAPRALVSDDNPEFRQDSQSSRETGIRAENSRPSRLGGEREKTRLRDRLKFSGPTAQAS
jgi:hypothetical protein